MPPAQTKEVIERELNAPLEDVFEWIDLEKPLGSASISQVSFLLLPICYSHSSAVTLAVKHSVRPHCTCDHSRSGPNHSKCTPLPEYNHQVTTVWGANCELVSWLVCTKQIMLQNTMSACNVRPLTRRWQAIAGPQG